MTAISIDQALEQGKQRLMSALSTDHQSASVDVKALLCEVLDCSVTYLFTWPEKALSEEQFARYQAMLEQREMGKPIAYILGYRDFWDLRLKVADCTLVPRPETELLVEHAQTLDLPQQPKVLDLGTGTGAIALALKSAQPEWQIDAVDFRDDVVALAATNAKDNQLDVQVWRSDWFSEVTGQYALILSNPPYVEPDSPYLEQGDLRFEPNSALVASNNGMQDIITIAQQAKQHLLPGGWLLMEHGYQQADLCQELLKDLGYVEINSLLDLAGHQRVTFARRRFA